MQRQDPGEHRPPLGALKGVLLDETLGKRLEVPLFALLGVARQAPRDAAPTAPLRARLDAPRETALSVRLEAPPAAPVGVAVDALRDVLLEVPLVAPVDVARHRRLDVPLDARLEVLPAAPHDARVAAPQDALQDRPVPRQSQRSDRLPPRRGASSGRPTSSGLLSGPTTRHVLLRPSAVASPTYTPD